MESSPFNRSSRTVRTPPPMTSPHAAPQPKPAPKADDVLEVISTAELHGWMSSIEQCLNEVCIIASEGKLNSDQKLRINNLCRKVGNGTSHMAVQYQSLKLRTVQAHTLVQTLQEESDLSQCLKDMKRAIKETSTPASCTSFADMVKRGNNSFVQPTSVSSVAIYPDDKLKTSEETKSLVQKIICPEQMKLHVRGLRKTKNGGVIISTETKADIDKLKQMEQIKTVGLQIDEPHKRKPRIVIIGVPTTMKDSEVLNCLYQQNLADSLPNSTLETFLDTVKISHKSGKKNYETCNYIIEVSAAIRKALIIQDRVFVNWSSCPIRDFTLVTRCYKCQQYGHAAKTCREVINTCGHCGEKGHSMKECLKKDEDPKCATCMHYKKPSNHATGFIDCPAKITAEKRYIGSIDYGVVG